jgi:hypothetical protein
VWCHTPVIPALEKALEFKTSLGYIVNSVSKKKKKKIFEAIN